MSDLRNKANKFLLQFGTSKKKVTSSYGPIVFVKANDCFLFDENGKNYIDGLSGSWVVNAGHCKEEIIEEIMSQYSKLGYAMSSEGYTNDKAIELAEELNGLLPSKGMLIYFTSGGSEAVEIAIRFARIYHKIQGKRKRNIIVSRHGSYHGGTLLTLSASGYDLISKSLGPVPEGLCKISQPYCHKCKYDKDECGVKCAYELEEIIERNGADKIAAFIGEPISANSGVAVPPKEYWKIIRNICDKYGILLIIDEVLTGFCRTGKYFAIEHYGIEPDIITISKGLTSGYAPLGAVAVKKEFCDRIPDNAFLPQGFTYSGHPISCSAALSNLKYMKENKLDYLGENKGIYLLKELEKQLDNNKYISDIRGIGLLLCIELGGSEKLKNAQVLNKYFLDNGLYTRIIKEYIHIAPPLTISYDIMNTMINIIANGFKSLEKQYNGGGTLNEST